MEPTERSYAEEGGMRDRDTADTTSDLPDWTALADQVQHEIRHQTEVRPYVTVLAAAGLGYIVAAGIPRWLWRYAFDMASKMLVAKVVATVVEED
jgi:hypothetical protein